LLRFKDRHDRDFCMGPTHEEVVTDIVRNGVRSKSTVISTSTRNFDDRMGDGARVYLGSAELAAVAALLGKLPTAEEYFKYINERVEPKKSEIYRYLEFDKMGNFKLTYVD